MADRTKAQLANRVLEILLVASPGNPADAGDRQTASRTWEDTAEDLEEREICFVGDPNTAIPSALFEDLAIITASRCASSFGVTGAELASRNLTSKDALLAEDRIMQKTTSKYSGQPARTEYF